MNVHNQASEKKEEVVEKKDTKPVKQAKGGKAAAKADPAKEEVAHERHNSGDAPKDQRKGNYILVINIRTM